MSIRVGEYTEISKSQASAKCFTASGFRPIFPRKRSIIGDGSPAPAIERVAREEDVSLIVIGSHGRSAAEDVLLGSVSDAVICRPAKPVLVVRPVRVAMPV